MEGVTCRERGHGRYGRVWTGTKRSKSVARIREEGMK